MVCPANGELDSIGPNKSNHATSLPEPRMMEREMKDKKPEKAKLTFSDEERSYIINGDLLFSEVGLALVERVHRDDLGFHLECSQEDYEEFSLCLADEMSYRGTRPGEAVLSGLSTRFADHDREMKASNQASATSEPAPAGRAEKKGGRRK